MNFEKLDKILAKKKEKPFRKNQIFQAVFKRLITDWDEATNLSFKMRKALKKDLAIFDLEPIEEKRSKDGTIKELFKLKDGFCVEAVLMRYKGGRNTVCVSSMAGCPMGCKFCATGTIGFKRNLTAGEICEQTLFFSRLLKEKNEKIGNVVVMGMGEPFLNYDNVMKAINVLNSDKYGFGIGARKISVSTCGIPDKIKKFADEPVQVNLAVSLHAPNDKTRSKIMPSNKQYPINEVMKAAEYYVQKTKRKLMFEYLLIAGLNDAKDDAKQLAALLKKNPLFHLNIIKYHGFVGKFVPSSSKKRREFFDFLKKNGVSVTTRMSFGEDIEAACGQLVGK